ncbi:alpha/beta hydrolase [Polaromonas jejuensis]|nr:alpha/beta hydrolase [Polaromonas jejuensis]
MGLWGAGMLLAAGAAAQVPQALGEKLKAMGRVIAPPATSALYAPLVLESEPYAGVRVERDIRYGEAERHLLDVFSPQMPSAKAFPVLIFVHGGGFVAGNRRASASSPFYDNIMLWAVRNGMVGVNMTYRLSPQNPWPAGPADVGQGVSWVHEQIVARGGDPSRIYLLGHSAGATHVAAYVAQERFHKVRGSGLAGALLLSGVYRVTAELVAVSPTYPGYYGTDASEYPARSALDGLIATRVPLWVGGAELDPPDFESQMTLLNDSLCKAGRCPAFVRFPGHSHMSEIYSVHTDDRSVSDAMLAFIKPR